MTPLVTIVIPCYNGLPHLKETFESVFNQSYKNWELIYIDDQSKDQSYELALEYAKKDQRVKVLKNEKNLGMAGNWNKALKQGTGEFIKILCADDLLKENSIQLLVDALIKHPDASLATGGTEIFNAKSLPIFRRKSHFSPDRPYNKIEVLNLLIEKGANIIGEPSLVLFRRKYSDLTSGFNSNVRYTTDICFWFDLLTYGPLVSTNEIVGAFRVHPNSLTSSGLEIEREEWDLVFEDILKKDKSFEDLITSGIRKFSLASLKHRILKKSLIWAANRSPLAQILHSRL